ncbi:DUF2231 domain-containing protein [Qipengyuania sp. MTN3-11]|uniref:DUF2231 domain-containing protein n=1 Tax=Qipengyuania sp. MTN3-11 TaxID=3056557 RepID=UPI0036F2697F
MIAAIRGAALLLLLVLAQPVWAHGEERHSEAPADTTPVSASSTESTAVAEARAAEEAPVRLAAEHDAGPGSIWTSLHPATVHFPIALLLAAALVEFVSIFRPSTRLTNAVSVMASGGAAGAVVAALFGWIHTGLWFAGDTTMQWHRWTGTSLAVVAPVVAILSIRANRWPFRMLLLATTLALLAQGYWGGELAHGPNHLGL